MINRLQELMGDAHLVENLIKSKKGNQSEEKKIEAWDALRSNIFTKLLSELYCNCILVCYMRVQMSIVGAQVYVQTVNYAYQQNLQSVPSSNQAEVSHMRAYTKYHALLGSFYEQRLDCLTRPLEQIIRETLREYKIDYSISMHDIKEIFNKVKLNFSKFLVDPDSKAKVLFLDIEDLSTVDLLSVCPDSGTLTNKEEEVLRNLLAETQDILESDDFKHVLESSIDVGYAVLLDTIIFDAFIKLESNTDGDSQSSFQPNGIQIPMVKLLPQIRSNYSARTEANKKAMVNHLLCLDVLNCFASNVYEAFSVPK